MTRQASREYASGLRERGADGSVGGRHGNALAETIDGLHDTAAATRSLRAWV
ncbi:hypothetical protein [Azospirillum doebereinerae]